MSTAEKPRVVIDIEDLRAISGESEDAAQPQGVHGGAVFTTISPFRTINTQTLANLLTTNLAAVLASEGTVMCPW